MTAREALTKPVAWMDEKGNLFRTPRHELYGLVDDTCGNRDVLWSGFTFEEAIQAWREITAKQTEEVTLTGWGCGVLADHQDMAWRYGAPHGTFACPICKDETPHVHTAEEIGWQHETSASTLCYREKRWKEIDGRIAELEAKHPWYTPLYAHPQAASLLEDAPAAAARDLAGQKLPDKPGEQKP